MFITTQEHLVMDAYTASARAAYASFGLNGIKKWTDHLADNKKIKLYLLNLNDKTINGPKPIPKDMTFLASHLPALDDNTSKYGNLIIGPVLIKTDNDRFRLVSSRDNLENAYVNKIPSMMIRLVMSLISGFILCYLVVVLIYRKIKVIRQSVSEIKKGNFKSIRNKRTPGDEISLLFNEVYEMSNTIDSLIKSKNRLLQDISHEFRSPLARQLAAIAISKRKCHSLDYAHLKRIEDENLNLESLVSELLEYSKINRKKALVLQSCHLNDMIKKVIDNTHYEFQTNCIKHEVCDEITYQGDPALLYRALENIVRNAVKYAGMKKEIFITLSASNDEIQIKIEDNGPGVREKDLKLMFHPFNRLEHKSSTHTKGYGLGLAIAKEIIEIHHGTISAENSLNTGLIVIITLPIYPA